MNRSEFFASVRNDFGALSQSQVEGYGNILDEAIRRKVPLRQLAYILATAWHETAHTMQPIREMGGEAYLKSKKYYPWVGEGLVQVTWEANHRKFGATKPGQLMTWPIALRALFDGMLNGIFTGKKLSDYINPGKTDYVNARRIVNGTDRAALIAGHAQAYQKALEAAKYDSTGPVLVPPAPLPPDVETPPKPVPAAPRGILKAIIDLIIALFGRK